MSKDKHGDLNSSPPPALEGGEAVFTPSAAPLRHWRPANLLPRLLHAAGLLRRGVTLGVRAVVVNNAGEFLLLKHSYVAGWHLPGGGVEVGETAEEALARELMEEAALTLCGPASFHGLFLNDNLAGRDHVAVYVVEQFRAGKPSVPNREIRDLGFFAPAALPPETTPATRRRIEEYRLKQPPATRW